MKLLMPIFFIALVTGCSLFPTYGFSQKLLASEQQIVDCEFETALATLQQFTVIGSDKEKGFALELMGVIYQEKMELAEFNHTVERFLFSTVGRGKNREMVILQWNEKSRQIQQKRVYQIGIAECEIEAVILI